MISNEKVTGGGGVGEDQQLEEEKTVPENTKKKVFNKSWSIFFRSNRLSNRPWTAWKKNRITFYLGWRKKFEGKLQWSDGRKRVSIEFKVEWIFSNRFPSLGMWNIPNSEFVFQFEKKESEFSPSDRTWTRQPSIWKLPQIFCWNLFFLLFGLRANFSFQFLCFHSNVLPKYFTFFKFSSIFCLGNSATSYFSNHLF